MDIKSRWQREWARTNPVLRNGELAQDRNSGRLKVGDGRTPWDQLPFVVDSSSSIGSDVIRFPALAKLDVALAVAEVTPCRIVFTGSSTSAAIPGWVDRFVTALQSAYPASGTVTPLAVSTTATFATPPTTPGVQGFNAAEGGTTAATYLTDAEVGRIVALNPAAIIHMVGSNDYATDVPPATYKQQIQSRILALDAGISRPHVHILVQPYAREGVFVYAWSEYGRMIQEIADADPHGVAFFDFSDEYAALGVPGLDPLDLLSTDGVHQNQTGYRYMTELMLRVLGIPGPRKDVVASGGSTAVISGIYNLIALDTFTRADSAVGKTETGQDWIDPGPGITWNVVSNACRGNGHLWFEAATGDVDISADLVYLTGVNPGACGLQVNATTSPVDRIIAFRDGPSFFLMKSDNNVRTDWVTLTTMDTTHPITAGVRYRWRLVSRGPVLTFYIDGVQIATYTLTAGEQTKFKALTRVGLRSSSPTNIAFDNVILRGV